MGLLDIIKELAMSSDILVFFTQRLKDCLRQDWHDRLITVDRFAEYRTFKQEFGTKDYLISLEG